MDPRFLKQLATIVKFGSLKRAAEHLQVAQPTLTRVIQQIEEQVGGAVLIRSKHGVTATDIGKQLAQVGKKIIAQEEESKIIVDRWQHGLQKTVNIGGAPLMTRAIGHQIIPALMELQPAIEYHTGIPSALLERLNDGELDLVLAPSNVDVNQENLVRKVVYHDRLALFVGRKSPYLGYQGKLADAQLKEMEWMRTAVGPDLIDPVHAPLVFGATRISLHGSTETMLKLMDETALSVVLPKKIMLKTDGVKADQLVACEREWPDRDFAIWMRREKLTCPVVTGIVEVLEPLFANLDQ